MQQNKKNISPDLARLVDELIKTNPNQDLVKNLMQKCEIPYSKDPLLQMSQVLENVNKTTRMKEL